MTNEKGIVNEFMELVQGGWYINQALEKLNCNDKTFLRLLEENSDLQKLCCERFENSRIMMAYRNSKFSVKNSKGTAIKEEAADDGQTIQKGNERQSKGSSEGGREPEDGAAQGNDTSSVK